MSNSVAALKAQFDLHTRLFNNVLESVSDTESNARNSEHVNHMKWVAGHLLNTRLDTIAKMTGSSPDTSYGTQFGRGVALDPYATYPPIEEITTKWNAASSTIGNNFDYIPEEVLASEAPVKTPVADETMRGLLAFLVSHEAYHIGQLSILRKLVGKDAMSYK